DFGLEGFVDLSRGPRKIDEHTVRIDQVHPEAMRLEPEDDRVEILLREAEAFAKLLRREPMVKIGRASGLQIIDKFLDGLFLFGRALQLEQHVVHLVNVSDAPAIIFEPGFGAHVALQRDALRLFNLLNDPRMRITSGSGLAVCRSGTQKDGSKKQT